MDDLDDFSTRMAAKQRLEGWLKESPRSVMLLLGPKGYGKLRLVSTATESVKQRIELRLDEIMARSEADLAPRLAR